MIDNVRARQVANGVAAALFFVFGVRLLWPAPIGVMVQGLVIGGLTALIAFGLALVYRSNRIINFAQGDLGGVPASLAVLLILDSGWPYPIAFGAAIVSAIGLGAVVEFVFIRRFRKAPRLILMVVTIGVSQILAAVAAVLPRAFGLTTPPQDFPSPFSFTFSIGRTVFHGDEVLAMIVVPVVIGALAAFFRYTRIGIAVRASAENSDRAALLGVPVARIQTVVWVIATVLATIAIFLRAGIVGLPIGQVLGPTILIRALAAAVIGRMEKLPTIFAASLGLGVVEACIVYSSNTGKLVDPILFVVVLGALLLQRRRNAPRVSEDEQSTWQASRQVRPIPAELAALPEIVWGRRIATALGVIVLFALPTVLNEGQINLAAVVLILAMVGVSLVVLTGWAGQVSLGQVAFMGIGAAVAGYLSLRGWDIAISVPVAGLAGAIGAMVIGLPALRVRGLYLAVVTLAFALATSSYFLDADFIHWVPDTGDRIARPFVFGRISLVSEARMYEFVVVIFLLAVWAVHGLRNSRSGRVLIGVRENPRAAQAFGVNTTSAKLMAFAVSGFIAAVAGAVFVHHQTALGNSAYTVDQSREAFTTVVIGGLGSVPGALLGSVFIQGVDYFRSSFPSGIRPILGIITSGFGLVFVLLFLPGGFSQLYYAGRDRILRFVAKRRGIAVPSLIADGAETKSKPESIELDLREAITEEPEIVVA